MPGPKKQDDSDDIVDDRPYPRRIPVSQGLRSGIANTTRRERMDADYPAQPRKNYKKGGKVAAKGRKK